MYSCLNVTAIAIYWRTFTFRDACKRIYFASPLRLTSNDTAMKQAEALGDYFAKTNVSIDAIYTSDLLRAKTTANAVRDRQTSAEIPFQELHLLREQHFGAGEGMKFAKKENNLSITAHYAKGKFPALHTRQQKFPGGESLDELADRAENIIDEVITPEVLKEQQEGRPRTVVIFSHGIFIAELVTSILKKDGQNQSNVNPRDLRGMHNTGCTTLNVISKVFLGLFFDVIMIIDSFFCPNAPLKVCEELGKSASAKSMFTAFSVELRGINQHAHLSDLVSET